MNIQKLIRIASLTCATLGFITAFAPTSHARTMTVDWGAPTLTEQGTAETSDDKQSGDFLATQADALNQAIVSATIEEGFALLPQDMSSAQRSALRKYLASKAQTLVRGYHEESVSVLPSGQHRLVVDVNVDKQWLIDALQRLGVYYLMGHETLPCTFYYIGQTSADNNSSTYKKAAHYVEFLATAAGLRHSGLTFMTTAEFTAMDTLAGVGHGGSPVAPVVPVASGGDNGSEGNGTMNVTTDPHDPIAEALNAAKLSTGRSVEAGQGLQNSQPAGQNSTQKSQGPKSLRFLLIPEGKDAWSATLQDAEYDASADGSSIDAVWGALWPAYVSTRFEPMELASDASSLQVWGWTSADGAVTLDKAMRTWYQKQGGDVSGMNLITITMQGGAVKALWRIDAVDSKKLTDFVRDYTKQRRLRYEFMPSTQSLNGAE